MVSEKLEEHTPQMEMIPRVIFANHGVAVPHEDSIAESETFKHLVL